MDTKKKKRKKRALFAVAEFKVEYHKIRKIERYINLIRGIQYTASRKILHNNQLKMSASTVIAQAFGENANLYVQVLGLEISGPEVTSAQLRKAYYRQALKYHPDKQNHSDKSAEEIRDSKLKFEAISVAYSILSDEERRKVYDEVGELDDSDDFISSSDGSNSEVWRDYFTGLFGKVTTADIDKFADSYKCSEEEERDVLKYYTQFQGDLGKMLECVMCSEEIDKKRWVDDYIQPAIHKGLVENYMDKVNQTMEESFVEENISNDDLMMENEANIKKRKPTKASKPKNSHTTNAKPKKTKKNDAPSLDLIAAIQGRTSRNGGAGGLIAELEARYSNPKSSGGEKKKNHPMTDEEFEIIQKRLGLNKK